MKMWTYAVLLFALCGGAFGATCGEEGLHKKCQAWFSDRPAFPKTEEDVLAICPRILSHLDCVQNYVDECGRGAISDTENLDKYEAYLKRLCKEDSPIRADVVKELPCIKQNLGKANNTCFQLARNALNNYMEESVSYEDYEDFGKKYSCVLISAEVSCMAADFDLACGSGARDVLLNALFSVGYLDAHCDKDETETVLQLVAILELELSHKERISDVVRTYHAFEF